MTLDDVTVRYPQLNALTYRIRLVDSGGLSTPLKIPSLASRVNKFPFPLLKLSLIFHFHYGCLLSWILVRFS